MVVPRIETWKKNKERFTQMEVFLDETIPDDASVSASTFLLPHIASRDEIYEVKYHENKPDIEYVVLDARYASHKPYYEEYIKLGYTVFAKLDKRIIVLKQPVE